MKNTALSSSARCFAFRVMPGEDLFAAIREAVDREGLRAAVVVCAVGSVTRARLRFANAEWGDLEGPFEIVSLIGTVEQGGEHLHIALSDDKGAAVGGHFGPGAPVFTTAEIVLAELEGLEFRREHCPISQWPELVVAERAGN